ncbi:MAG: GWxTD domain-containing protein, partial [Candidatus Cloacimonadaceae bacterium]
TQAIALKIPLTDLKAGKYQGTISLQAGEILQSRDFEFVLSEDTETMLSLFPDPDDEFKLMRYFMTSRALSNWESLNTESKRRYITNFWKNMALSTRLSEQGILDLVHERVEHANRYYSSQKPGWNSDMGRIYIRSGAPAEIEKGQTSDDTRFVRKDYQIWKYRSGDRPVYVFLDQQMSNNFRLIYVSNDDMEISNPDWLRLIGRDFDESLLRN